MTRGWLALLLSLLLASTNAAAGSRILSVLLPGKADEGLTFTVSPDRQSLYVVTGSGESSQITLQIIDVADPARPVRRASLLLRNPWVWEMVARSSRLFVLAQRPPPTPGEVLVIDMSRPQGPAVIGRQPLHSQGVQLEVAADGSCLGASGNDPSPAGPETYAVATDGRLTAGGCPQLVHRRQRPDTQEWVTDQAGPDSLVLNAGRCLLRAAAGAGIADRNLSVPGSRIEQAGFLASPDKVAAKLVEEGSGSARLVVLDTARPAFDPARLRRADAAALHTRRRFRATVSRRLDPSTAEELALRLNDAGAQEALARSPALIRRWGLVPILDNWGYWQSHALHPVQAIPTLQRVVEVAPTRAGAWRNLGDAARAALPFPDADRPRLTRIALDAYAAYQKLTGHLEPDMADFVTFNALNTSKVPLCQLITGYYNRGRRQEINAAARLLDVNGRKLWVDISTEPTDHPPSVEAIDVGGRLVEQPSFGLAAALEEDGWVSGIEPVSARGALYAVFEQAGNPVSVRDWNGRRLCHFRTHDAPAK